MRLAPGCLRRRKLYAKACKTTKKAGAPGDLFVAECKKDDMCRRFLGLGEPSPGHYQV